MQIENINRVENDIDKAILNKRIAEIKERLKAYRDREKDIDNQIQRLEKIAAKLTGLGSLSYTGMPRTASPASDRVADVIGIKIGIESKIGELQEYQKKEREELSKVVCRMPNPDEKAVIQMRYFDGEKWNAINRMIFGKEADFDLREDSYLRRTHRLHGKALTDMAYVMYDIPE